MKVLFIARTYPPIVGGMQRFASDFYQHYKKIGEIDLIANPGGNQTVLFFALKLFFTLALNARKYDVIHFSDAILAPLIVVIRLCSRAKVSFTVHGLDIVYSRFGYQKLIPPFLKKADKIFAVSQYTLTQCQLRGIPPHKLMVIPNSINFESLALSAPADPFKIISKFNINHAGKKILLTVGRLIKRKGHAWFLKNVFAKLSENYIYIIAGVGNEYEDIQQAIKNLNIADRVYLLGYISEEEKKCLYQTSDLFIMPNVSVADDQEGFGIVLIEAGRYGLPVIAANIEGIRDAVLDGQTGHLIPEQDAPSFIKAITNPKINAALVAEIVEAHFDSANIMKRYAAEFEKLCAGRDQ